MFLDYYYLVLVVPAILISFWAQSRVSSTYNRYQKVQSYSGLTGAQVARRILDDNGLYQVQIEQIHGNLTDHYDPRQQVVRLSSGVYGSTSVAAIGIAAHETGHAVQHATQYAPLTLRNAIIPVTNFGAKLSMPLILFGLLAGMDGLIYLGIVAFSLMVLFQLATLPVEFNASRRALNTLETQGILRDSQETDGAKKVLSAAALTYVAALLVSVAQLLRLVLMFGGRRRR